MSNDFFQHTIATMESARTYRDLLAVILEQTIALARPEVAHSIEACAVPHWFNSAMVGLLVGSDKKPEDILAQLANYSFVESGTRDRHRYHETARGYLLERLRRTDPGSFLQLNQRAFEYFDGNLRRGTSEAQTECERERMYHLLAVNQEDGFREFERLFWEAEQYRHLGICNSLLQLVAEQSEMLTGSNQLRLQYLEGVLAGEFSQWAKAIEIFKKLIEESPLELRPWLASEIAMVYEGEGKWESSITWFSEALKLTQRIGDSPGEASILRDMGRVYQDKGKWTQALDCFQASLATYRALGDRWNEKRLLQDMGSIYWSQGKDAQAIECFGRAHRVIPKGDAWPTDWASKPSRAKSR